MQLSHVGDRGRAVMVDVSRKEPVRRSATASCKVHMKAETVRLLRKGLLKKGDAFACARLAGIMAAKKTSDLIPLCHPLMLTSVTIDLEPDDSLPGVHVRASVKLKGKTGVEMEALTAVSVACLTIYDMAKAVDRAMTIGEIRLIEKSGGKSGHFKAGAG